jgi:hypothetical protein
MMNDNEKIIAEIERQIDSFREISNDYKDRRQVCNLIIGALSTVKNFVKELSEESIGKDLQKAGKEWLVPQLDKSYANYGETKMMELTHFDGYAMLDAIEFGAQWMASQGEAVVGLVVCNELTHGYKDIVMSIPKSLNVGDKVILTIRKVNRKTNTDVDYLCWNDMTDKQKSDFLYELSHQPVITPDEDLPVHKS